VCPGLRAVSHSDVPWLHRLSTDPTQISADDFHESRRLEAASRTTCGRLSARRFDHSTDPRPIRQERAQHELDALRAHTEANDLSTLSDLNVLPPREEK
jgi:hypothetical protein